MAKSIEEKRREAAEASRRWRERHPERAKQVERDAYHRRQQREGKASAERAVADDAERIKRAEARKAYHRKWAREWRRKHPELARENNKRNYDRNREAKCAKSREWYAKNRDAIVGKMWVRRLKSLYGLTPDQYFALGTRCAICGTEEDARGFRLAVDHDHATKKVRGLLCGNCNCGIGFFNHDESLLTKAIDYLRQTL